MDSHEAVGGEGWLRLGIAAELAKKYGADERDFLRTLALLLERALPGETTIERGGWFGKGPIQRIIVALGDWEYTLTDPGRGPLQATRARAVRGIRLKSDDLPVPEWINELGVLLDERARTSEAAREALARYTDL